MSVIFFTAEVSPKYLYLSKFGSHKCLCTVGQLQTVKQQAQTFTLQLMQLLMHTFSVPQLSLEKYAHRAIIHDEFLTFVRVPVFNFGILAVFPATLD